jgi:hypothetical protein
VKATVYTIEDEYLGIPLLIEGELIDYEDEEPPFVVIQDISYGGNDTNYRSPLELWCLSEAFIKHCQDRIFQQWCSEVLHA